MRHFRLVFVLLALLCICIGQTVGAEDCWQDGEAAYFPAADGTFLKGEADSFAVSAVEYRPGTPRPENDENRDPGAALGFPDFVSVSETPEAYVSLGSGGQLVLEFGAAIFDEAGEDIYVFEVGPSKERVTVEVSADLAEWIEVGTVSGTRGGVDLQGKVPEGESFRFVRLTDDGSNQYGQPYPGADIDAVCVMPRTSELYRFTDRENRTVVVPTDSFADEVMEFTPGTPFTSQAKNGDPAVTLGLPDYSSVSDGSYLSMGGGGVLVLRFDREIVDGDGDDVYIFEVGPSVEACSVEVSVDQVSWYGIGLAQGKTAGLDLRGKVPEHTAFRYVRITDQRTNPDMPTPGADIDAVCGLNTTRRTYETRVPASRYCIHVVDENGRALPDAKVRFDGEEKLTNENGNALFSLFTVETPLVEVSKRGYLSVDNRDSSWAKSDSRYETVILYPTGSGKHKLKSAQYSNYSSMRNSTNLLTSTKKVKLPNDGNHIGDLDGGGFYLTCAAVDGSGVRRYELWQGRTKLAESADGAFGRISVSGFSKGGGCFIRVISGDGKRTDTRINLVFDENAAVEESGISVLHDKLQITAADDIPFLGGTTFSVGGVDLLPVEIKVTDEKIYVGFNAKIWKSGDDPEEAKGAFDEFKKKLENLRKARDTYKSGGIEGLKELQRTDPEFQLPGGKIKVSILGFAEGDFGSPSLTGEIHIVFKGETPTFGFTTWVVVVPVTVQVGGYLEFDVGAKVSYDWGDATLEFDLPMTLTLGLEAFGGIGMGPVFGVGAYGSADVDFDMDLMLDPFLRGVDLTGSLGLKVYAGPFEASRAFAHHTWNLYTANTVSSASLMGAEASWKEGLYDASLYRMSDLSYLAGESPWRGEEAALLAEDGPGAALTPLLTDTYRNARPVMVSSGSALYAAFVRADMASGCRFAAVTKYDGSGWTAPLRADEAAILDDAPQLWAGEDGALWLAYARTVGSFPESLRDYGLAQEIVVGSLDPDTLAFTEAAVYPGGFTHLQRFCTLDGRPMLVWADAEVTDDDSVARPAASVLRCALCTDGVWGEAFPLGEADMPLDSLTPGVWEGEPAAAFTSEGTLYLAAAGNVSELASGVTGALRFGVLPGTGEAAFLWNGEGALHTSSGASAAIEGITHEFAVLGSSVYYSMASGDGADLAVIRFENGAWGTPVRLTETGRYLENLSAARMEGKDYVLGLLTAVTIGEDSVEDLKDLVWSGIEPVRDLRLKEITWEDRGLSAGDTVPVTLTVTNAGDCAVEAVAVALGEETVLTERCSLLPGRSLALTVELTCPETLTAFPFTVTEPGAEDHTPEDNAAPVMLGYADVETELEYRQIGARRSLLALVSNVGVETANGRVVFYDARGEAVAERAFQGLAAGDTAVVAYEMPEGLPGAGGGDVFAAAVLLQEELYTSNNTAGLFVPDTDNDPADRAEITLVSAEGTEITAAVACRGSLALTLHCAWYSEEGRLLSAETIPLETGTSVHAFRFDGPEAARAKLFVLDEELAPMCWAETIGLS